MPTSSPDHDTPRPADRDDKPALPDRSRDDEDRGWGDQGDGRRDRDWYERERPPHHE